MRIQRKAWNPGVSTKLVASAALAVAGVLCSGSVLADRQRTVIIHHAVNQPVVYTTHVVHYAPVVVYGAPVGYSAPVIYSPAVFYGSTVYGSTVSYRTPVVTSVPSFTQPAVHRSHGASQHRGSWSNSRHRDVIYVNRDSRKGSSYREVERTSVMIRDRSR
jgi:hypothetical protein